MSKKIDLDIEKGMSLLDHLNELRRRLTWAAIGLAVGTVLSFTFTQPLLEFLLSAYEQKVIVLRPTENIEIYFKTALVAGAVLSMPFILYQLWLFIREGLENKERRYVYIFLPGAMILFLGGISFAWFLLLPPAIFFLSNFMPTIFETRWQAQEYISFVTTFLLWIGVSFEMPLVVYFLARVGFVTAALLREQWRLALVGIAVLAAAVTPSVDPVTMLLTMVPLLILYGFSIILAKVGERQFAKVMAVDD